MPAFEYLHTWISVAEDEESDEDSDYDYLYVQAELNGLGQEGWELMSMTPDWEWDVETTTQEHYPESGEQYDVRAPYSFPRFISGWFCTFKRAL